MDPIAAITIPPTQNAVPAAPALAPRRDVASERDSTERRSIELLPDRVQSEDNVRGPRRSQATRSTGSGEVVSRDARATSEDPAKSLEEGLEAARERIEKDLALAVSAKNQAVTYRVVPDLQRVQGRVVDRTTSEEVKTIPADPQIELSRRIQNYLGVQIDIEA